MKPINKLFRFLFKTHRTKLIIGIVFLLIVGLIIKSKSSKKDQPEFTYENPVIQDLTKTLEVSGIIDAKEKANLRFAAGGKVVYLGAKEGDWVKKWQTIATIDRASLQKTQEQTLNNYMKERWDWEEQLDDVEDRTIDTSEKRTVDKNQWDLENTVLNVEIQDIAIKNTALTAPFAGVLVSSPTSVTGVNLLATDIFELVNPETLVFKALVDEADISLVRSELPTEIELDSYAGEIINSAISYIAYKSTAGSSGTVFLIEMPLPSQDSLEKFRIGMNGDVKIMLETKQQVMTIPVIALKERDNKTYVDVKLNEKETQEKEIVVGMETDDLIEVISGLSESDQVAIPN